MRHGIGSSIDKKFLQNCLEIIVTKGFLFILSMFTSVFFARVLGSAGKGEFSVATSITGMGVQFGNLGLATANTYFIAKNKRDLGKAVGSAALISGLALLIVSVTLFVADSYLQYVFELERKILFSAFLLIPAQLFILFQQNILIACSKIKIFNVSETLMNLLLPFFMLIYSLWGNVIVYKVLIANIIADVIIVIFDQIWLIREMKMESIKISISGHYLRKCLPIGVKVYIASLLTYLVLRVDILMINSMVNKQRVGIYSLAVSLSDILALISNTVSLLLFPRLVSINEMFERRKYFINLLLQIGAVMLIFVVGGCIISDPTIRFLYGIEYIDAIPIFRVLLLSAFIWGMIGMINNYFASNNRYTVVLVSAFVGLGCNIICNLWLIPRLELWGAAIASLISYMMICFILLTDFYMEGRVQRGTENV